MDKNLITSLPIVLEDLDSIRSRVRGLDARNLSEDTKDRLKAVLAYCSLIEGLYKDAVALSCHVNFPKLSRQEKEIVHA